ncbi:MAG: hypothetical protein PVS2B2_10680 [Candidatus Acidiferrum sp.]
MRIAHSARKQNGGIFFSVIFLAFVALLCTVVYVARYPLMRLAVESWIVEDPLEHADAILVLGNDNFYGDRASRAAELFRQGWAPLIVASGKRLRPGADVAALVEHDLIERGVPKASVLRYAHDADNTREEAEGLLKLSAEHKWKSVIVVTSNYHTRRARYVFEKVYGKECQVRVASARDAGFDPEHWWEKRSSIKQFAREAGGMMVALWELRGKGN